MDHDSYDYSPALPALKRLKDLNIPVIPTTSKTIAEIEALDLPFDNAEKIAENGMVIFDGENTSAVDKSYLAILDFICALPGDLRHKITGFNDMSIDEVVKHTSLDPRNAELAKTRLGSEPFLWSGEQDEFSRIETLAHDAGFAIVRGGRFYHLMSANGGKDKAIKALLKGNNENAITIALGDGPNDADMLSIVDYGIKIPNASGHDFVVRRAKGKIIQSPHAGPSGWNYCVNALLDDLPL